MPGREALEELKEMKSMGFNLLRIHAAVMPAAFYHFCDVEGLLVWQDFPAGDGRALPLKGGLSSPLDLDEISRTQESEVNFWQELQAVISWLRPFASIVCWVPFNEGWGQFQSMQVVQWLRRFGGDRWINMASGWNDVADLFPGMDGGDVASLAPSKTGMTACSLAARMEADGAAPSSYGLCPWRAAHWSSANTVVWASPWRATSGRLRFPGPMGSSASNVSMTSEDFAVRLLSLGARLQELLCENWVSGVVFELCVAIGMQAWRQLDWPYFLAPGDKDVFGIWLGNHEAGSF
eukprot:s577_g2.t1